MSDQSPDKPPVGSNPPPPPTTSAANLDHPGPAYPAGPPTNAWVWAQQPGPAGRHSTTTLVLSIVAALVGGLVLGAGSVGFIWAVRELDSSGAQADDGISAEGAGEQPAEDVLPGELDRLMAYVERERGLTFTDDVEIQFLDEDAFADAWFSPPPGYEPPEEPADYGATYAALGLTPSPDDLYAAERSTSVAGLVGFYDPWAGELVIRGTSWTPMVEGTVVHELTHALQDQHFDLAAAMDTAGPEAELAARSLIEGDANRIELAYVEEQPAGWQDGYAAAWEDVTVAGPYDPLLDMVGAMPYWLGNEAMAGLLATSDGVLNETMRDLPTTTAEVVEIDRFIRGEAFETDQPEPPAAPDGAEVLDEGTLGVAFLELLHLDVQTDWFSNNYLSGWRGDRYTTWASDGGACTALEIRLAAPALDDAEEYFQPWAERTGGTAERLSDHSGIMLRSCAEW